MEKFFIYLAILSAFFISSQGVQLKQMQDVAKSLSEQFSQIYETLHQCPEMKYEEYQTSHIIQNELKKANITFTAGWGFNPKNTSQGGTGIVAQIGTGKSPCIGLRADIDALPIQENNNLTYKSKNDGVMHACGHDAHATMLLGGAKVLKHFEDEIEGTVKFFFQPAEEGGRGARSMINEGAFDISPIPEAMFAFHVNPHSPTGYVASTPGTIAAASNAFFITVKGKGGHVAMHHQTVDPVACATAIIQSIYTMNSREQYFQKPLAGVISITNIDGGDTEGFNVIPNEVNFNGTFRAFEDKTIEKMRERIAEIAEHIAKSFHAEVDIKFYEDFNPAVKNDEHLFEQFKNVIANATPDNTLHIVDPMMGSEDFAYISRIIPSVYCSIGTGSGQVGPEKLLTNSPLHNHNFVFDKNALPYGATQFANIAFNGISQFIKMGVATPKNTHDEL